MEKQFVPNSFPNISLSRDEKNIIYFELDDFVKLYKSIPKNQAGKVGKKEIYRKFPILNKAVERIEKEERSPSPVKKAGNEKIKKVEKKRRKKQFQFVFNATQEIGLNELQDILSENPYKFNFPVLKEVFDSFLSDDGNFVNVERLCELLQMSGLATFNSESDKKILIEALDKDKDGKISYQDLMYNIPLHNYPPTMMAELKNYMHMETASPIKDKKKTKGKKEPTCCIINREKLNKGNSLHGPTLIKKATLDRAREENKKEEESEESSDESEDQDKVDDDTLSQLEFQNRNIK